MSETLACMNHIKNFIDFQEMIALGFDFNVLYNSIMPFCSPKHVHFRTLNHLFLALDVIGKILKKFCVRACNLYITVNGGSPKLRQQSF